MHAARTLLKLRFTIAVLVMAALLLAQWTGLAHSIDHGPIASIHMDASKDVDSEGGSHSCLAFDAAAIADAIVLPPFAVLPIAGAKVLALWAAFTSWEPPPVLHFSSRAPPVS